MYHFYDVVINDNTGVPLSGVIIRLYTSAGILVPLFADEAGTTPIEAVSGIPDAAVTDGDGNYDFYVSDGKYDLRFFVGDALLKVMPNIQMVVAASDLDVQGKAQANAIGVSGSANDMGLYTSPIIPDGETAKQNIAALAVPIDNIMSSATSLVGSALVGSLRSDAGAVARTVHDEIGDLINRSSYSSLGAAWLAAGFKPLFDPTTGALYLNADPSPLNYSTSRARFVYQHRDTGDAGTNELVPAAVFQFNASGNGTVFPGIELSQSIWQGLFAYMRKTGDGSAHCYTAIGELGAYGPTGYGELGLVQGEGTNTGCLLATISGCENLIKDSPDGGVTHFSTKMQSFVARIARYHSDARKSHGLYASSEGSVAVTAIVGVNPCGLASWERGIDFDGATFTTGQSILSPNNTFIGWKTSGGAAAPIVGVNNGDDVFIAAATATNRVNITTSGFSTGLAVDQDASNPVLMKLAGVLSRVQVGAADSGGTGFKLLRVPN